MPPVEPGLYVNHIDSLRVPTQRTLKPTSKMHERRIVTLDPKRLSAPDFLDMSNYVNFRLSISSSGADVKFVGNDIYYYQTAIERKVSFPENTHGFLYFVPPPDIPQAPPIASEIRFRITRNSDPSSFATGRDLLYPNALPWRISIVQVARLPRYSGLRHLLLQDGLTTSPILDHCTALVDGRRRFGTDGRTIYSLGQLFNVDFAAARPSFFFASGESIYPIEPVIWGERRVRMNRGKKTVSPFSGELVKAVSRLRCTLTNLT